MASLSRVAILAIITRVFTLESIHAFSVVKESKTQSTNFQSRNNISRIISPTSLMAENRNGNPFKSLLGDMASSIMSNVGGGDDSGVNEELDRKLNEISGLSSWDDIKTKLESKQTEEEKAFRTNVEKGIGKASPLNKIRLFDESNEEEDIRVTLYRDSASWCPCKFVVYI